MKKGVNGNGPMPPSRMNARIARFALTLSFQMYIGLKLNVRNIKNIFFISQAKHMLWVLKRTV